MVLFIWIVTLFLLALWSLTGWGLHVLATLDPGWVGDLRPLIDRIPYADVIDAWVPGWRELMLLGVDLTQSLLGWVGAAAPVIVWIVWGFGTLALLGGAALLTLFVKLLKGSMPKAPASA